MGVTMKDPVDDVYWTYDPVTLTWWRFYELGRWVAYVTKEQLAKL